MCLDVYCYTLQTVTCVCFSVFDAASGRVEGLGDVVSIACGQDHSLAVCASGLVFSWGANEDGQLGILQSDMNNSHRPRQVFYLWNI